MNTFDDLSSYFRNLDRTLLFRNIISIKININIL